jgi:hypothetical protein
MDYAPNQYADWCHDHLRNWGEYEKVLPGQGWYCGTREFKRYNRVSGRVWYQHITIVRCDFCQAIADKEAKMNGSELYDLFAADATMEDIARMDVTTEVVDQIRELRQSEPDNIDMTDEEIAAAIVKFARKEIRV